VNKIIWPVISNVLKECVFQTNCVYWHFFNTPPKLLFKNLGKACMHIYIYIYVCVYVCVTHTHTCKLTHMHTQTHTHTQ